MQLERLISALEVLHVEGTVAGEIARIDYDSRAVKPGSLFVALRGGITDGHRHIERAVANGAVAVLVEEPYQSPRSCTIQVADTRKALADVAAAFFKDPSRKLQVAGVTGTNGKTTVTFLLKHICDQSFQRCGLIGTVRYEVGERILPALHTTPEATDIHSLLSQMVAAGCRAVSMEISSHALAQERVRNVTFDVAVFTNLTQDHLDYHGGMEEYFQAKTLLFEMAAAQTRKKAQAVINHEDAYGRKLIRLMENRLPVITFGVGAQADFRASSFRTEAGRTTYQLTAAGRSFLVRLPLIGRFNIYNSLAALAAAHALGIDLRGAVQALAAAPQVPGRLESVARNRNFGVYVDYAHTPDALENILRTLRDLNPRRLIVVFGCGGDRDRTKRPLMAKVVDAAADVAVVTSDNPRSEDPDSIIAEIRRGFSRLEPVVIPDRRDAIFRAIELAAEKDIVVIAGKGHETFQEVAGHKYPFDDVDVTHHALESKPASFTLE